MLIRNLFENNSPSEQALLDAIERDPYAAWQQIEHAMGQGERISPTVAMALVTKRPTSIQIFSDPPEALCLAAVVHEPYAIRMIKNPSERTQMAAVERDPDMIEYIEHPAIEVQKLAVTKDPITLRMIKLPPYEVQVLAVKGQPSLIGDMDNPPDDLAVMAIRRLGVYILRHLKKLNFNTVKAAIEKDPKETVNMFPDLPMQLIQIAYDRDWHTHDKFKKFKSYDGSLDIDYAARLRRHNRKVDLPHLGHRRPGTHNLSQDQLRLMRWFEKTGRDSIPVKELRQQSWGNTPYFADLVRKVSGRDITKQDLLATKVDPISATTRDLLSKAQVTSGEWKGDQRLFMEKPNRTAVFSVSGADIRAFINDEKETGMKLDALRSRSMHPTAQKKWSGKTGLVLAIDSLTDPELRDDKQYSLGWVRYTIFGKDIWIDEVQTDLPKVLPPGLTGQIKDMADAILLDFIRRMRRRGAERLFMPTYDMKKDAYKADPPVSTYQDLPRKMRFRQGTVDHVDPLVDGKTAWILEGAIKPGILVEETRWPDDPIDLRFEEFEVKPGMATTAMFRDATEAKLGRRGGSFPRTYLDPKLWFENGGYVVKMYDADRLIGIAMYQRRNQIISQLWPNSKTDGLIGFYVDFDYRMEGLASKMAERLYRHVGRGPKVICWNHGCKVASKAFDPDQLVQEEELHPGKEVAETTEAEYQKVLAALRRLPFADKIVVFGSVARGEARRSSDVDVFVDFTQGGVSPRALLQIAHQFYGMFDPFVMTASGLVIRNDEATGWVKAKRAPAILDKIESEGVPLAEIR